jgi:SAM-dependent methyltransferase
MTINKKIKYIHDELGHNLRAPSEIVPIIYNLVSPKSVIDLGCGLGTFIKVFKDQGVSNVLGIDGEWTNKDLLYKNILPEEFSTVSLTKPLQLKTKYDLAISLEVAEHIEESLIETYLDNVVSASDIVLFSAAIPYQGGFNHVNEQWSEYWENKFIQRGYIKFDILRTLFWGNPQIDFWYQQNICLYLKKDSSFKFVDKISNEKHFQNAVHPELYIKKATELCKILSGSKNLSFYLKLLIKKFLNAKNSRNNNCAQ